MAIDPTPAPVALRLARLRRVKRVAVLGGTLVAAVIVLGLRRCS